MVNKERDNVFTNAYTPKDASPLKSNKYSNPMMQISDSASQFMGNNKIPADLNFVGGNKKNSSVLPSTKI